MAYDPKLAERVRLLLRRRRGVEERKMFGGLAFLVNGHMSVGVVGRDLVLRLGKDRTMDALEEPFTREMDFTGKVLKSMVYVEPAGCRTEKSLTAWVDRALAYARSLPPKG
jgi:TfoX/Sxy family transcriptional regulator of competence genes